MNQSLLRIKKPDGKEYAIELDKLIDLSDREALITIGRQSHNQIVLCDPQKNISREHCSLQYNRGIWWIMDRGSSNGTFLRRGVNQAQIDVRNEELIPLKHEDEILILGELNELDKPLFWSLKFIDPEATNQVVIFQANNVLEYSFSQQKLFRITPRDRSEILLPDRELTLIDYMARKNHENGDRPVICRYEELITAVWQSEAFGVDKLDIHHLVWRIRHKIEDDSGEPKFLKTVRGTGYRLEIKYLC